MTRCDYCGNEFSSWLGGSYCPTCKARIEAAEAEKEYWENRKAEDEQRELDKVKAQQRLINTAYLSALHKEDRNEHINATAMYCFICGKVSPGCPRRCLYCGGDHLQGLELTSSEIDFLDGC